MRRLAQQCHPTIRPTLHRLLVIDDVQKWLLSSLQVTISLTAIKGCESGG